MASGSATSTMTREEAISSSQLLSSSVASLSATRTQTSTIAKSYRQAAQLFLTRRLSEALSAIEPIITPEQPSPLGSNGSPEEDGISPTAPMAAASRGSRVKVWSFYLTLLNAIIELGPEEGKLAFGSTKWRALASKARDGSIWDEVVNVGYGGVEGDVDGDVVVNLATLLLTHMPSQRLNQQRLESYLASSSAPSSLGFAQQLDASNHRPPSPSANGGTSTPRELNTRLKILEIYTLHVLPRNEEWDYARDFVSMNEVLDEERREAFLHALQTMQQEKDSNAQQEAKLRKEQESELERRQQEETAQRQRADRAEEDRIKEADSRPKPSSSQPGGIAKDNTNGRPTTPAKSTVTGPKQQPASRSPKQTKKPIPPPAGLYKRASSLFASFQNTLISTSRSMTGSPMALMRFFLFLLAFVLMFARRDLRERINRAMRNGWNKVARTVGMGVKVSYI
ncbi:hypothetical protein LTR66_002992 [Elasticomyces elasticus]|nr:hypothetical protein LTR66_002992 [Elasticomyces elasticus]